MKQASAGNGRALMFVFVRSGTEEEGRAGGQIGGWSFTEGPGILPTVGPALPAALIKLKDGGELQQQHEKCPNEWTLGRVSSDGSCSEVLCDCLKPGALERLH